MAPEVIGTTGNYDGKSADIWSCGIMLYVMLFGMYPFDGLQQQPGAQGDPQQQRAQLMMNRIIKMEWTIPSYAPVSPECRDLLQQLIVADPTKRLTMQQIQAHPWFLANLPGDALSMNDQCLANPDYTGGDGGEGGGRAEGGGWERRLGRERAQAESVCVWGGAQAERGGKAAQGKGWRGSCSVGYQCSSWLEQP